jgi:hypothetical protein
MVLRYLMIIGTLLLLIGLAVATVLYIQPVRALVKSVVRPEPPAQITPLAVTSTAAPTATHTPPPPTRTATSTPMSQSTPTRESLPTVTLEPTPMPTPEPTPTSGPVEVNGRLYDAYIPAATKSHQFYQYSCEFDAAWVILATYGVEATGEQIIHSVEHDRSIEPHFEETRDGILIHGGDITRAFSGDYTGNFLARSTGSAIQPVFERYDLMTTPVHDRPALEQALRAGKLVWIKTTVDFKPWRPATWVMPDGRTHKTVLGNDHAVVVMGFSERGVVIRDVLGPTSSNRQRPYEYEVGWDTFMAAWGAQSFDGLAVTPPSMQ